MKPTHRLTALLWALSWVACATPAQSPKGTEPLAKEPEGTPECKLTLGPDTAKAAFADQLILGKWAGTDEKGNRGDFEFRKDG